MLERFAANPGLTAIMAVLALAPALIWGFYYYSKDPEPKKLCLVTFFGGALSVLPVLAYQYAWAYIPELNVHYYIPLLLNNPSVFSIFFFLGISIVVAFLAFVVSVVLVTIVAALSVTKGILLNIKRSVLEEQVNFVLFGLIIGLFGLLILYFDFSLKEALIITMALAVLEEYSKHIIVRFTDDNRIKSIDDAIEFSVLVGLGFAFAENIFYFLNAYNTDQFYQIVIFRSILSVFAHILFSGIFGYFYGLAHFATPLYHQEVHEKRHPVLKFLHKVLHVKGSVLFHEEKMLEGLIVAGLLHTIFNFFLQLNQVVVVVPFLFAGYFLLSYLFDKKEDHKMWGYVTEERTTGKIHLMRVQEPSKKDSGEIQEFSD
jgi:RsiW-degrading membrane proteinase PrsW (M82 family)